MRYGRLGQTDIEVSAVAMGGWALADTETWGPQDEAASIATIHAALDAGVNLFDTAEGYGGGESERILGRALRGRRHKAVIATKIRPSNLSAEAVRRSCEQSLRRLQTDYIDLYQIHWPSRTVPIAETIDALQELRAQGRVRALGVCNFGPRDLADLLAVGHVETNQLPYSLLWRAIEYESQPQCIEAGLGILCYSPLMQGLLTGKFSSPDEVPTGRARTRHFSSQRPKTRHGEPGCESETFAAIERIRQISAEVGAPMGVVSLAWLLQQPGVNAVIVGARRPDQVAQTVQAAELELAPESLAALSEATEEVKRLLGPNPDMWQSESRFR